MAKSYAFLFLVFGLILSLVQQATAQESCEVRVHKMNPDLRVVKGPYTSAAGDFDDDGVTETAFFVEKSGGKKRSVAVCLSSRSDVSLINDLYVDESLSVSRKGSRFYNFNKDKEDAYPADGIAVSCCECCGATYLYSNGEFHQIVDSD